MDEYPYSPYYSFTLLTRTLILVCLQHHIPEIPDSALWMPEWEEEDETKNLGRREKNRKNITCNKQYASCLSYSRCKMDEE